MFELKFTPNFARSRKHLLAQSEPPHIPIPVSVEACLSSISFEEQVAGRPAGSDSSICISTGRLWLESVRTIRPLIFKAAGLSLISSACAASSTLVAMRMLRAGQGISALLGLSVFYFLMNGLSQYATFHSGRLRAWVGLGAESYLVGQISRKLLRLSSQTAARQSSGNLKILITSDIKSVGQFLDNVVRNLVPALTGLLVIAPLLIHFSGKAGAFGLGVMMLILPVSLVLNKVSSYYKDRSQTELDSLTSLAGEWVKNVRLIRSLSWDEPFRQEVSSGLRNFMKVSVAQHFMACLIFGLSISWWMVSITGVVVVSHWLHYPLDLIGFFGSLWLMTFLAGYFTHLPNTIRYYGEAAPSMETDF